MAYDLKEANGLITDMLDILRNAHPKNEKLMSAVTESRLMMKTNSEALHTALSRFLLVPHRAKIMAADDSFIRDLHEGDMLGLSDCYFTLPLEDRAAILYSLVRLSTLIP